LCEFVATVAPSIAGANRSVIPSGSLTQPTLSAHAAMIPGRFIRPIMAARQG
jgi:hypothetical protein